jgi:hypothetical protein
VASSHHAAALSSFSSPRITILSASSDTGRCSALAFSYGARIETSRSSGVVKITGVAFGWVGSTTAFGAVVAPRVYRWQPSVGTQHHVELYLCLSQKAGVRLLSQSKLTS